MGQSGLARWLCVSRPRGVRGSISVGWLITVIGLVLATVAGVLLGSTGASANKGMLVAGMVMLVLGALMAVLGVSGNSRLASLRGEVESLARHPGRATKRQERAHAPGVLPLVGELLIHKHHMITERDLARALLRQRETGGRLGRVLVEMGLVKWQDLAQVLEDQLSYGDPWHRGHRAEQPVGHKSEVG
jgi:ABC-type dipeptide/oligopeptide/nickel transport system permease subunit